MLSVRQHIKVNRLFKQWMILRKTSTAVATNANTSASRDVQNIQRSLDNQIERIDIMARRTGRVNIREITDMFRDIKSLPQSSSPSTSHSLLMIRCCGTLLNEELPTTRNQLVNEIFDVLSNSCKLDISHYNSLLQVYLDNEYEFNPLDILNKIEERGIEPNRVTYQRLIHRYCQLGDIEGATKILEFMKAKQLPINEYVFNSLILGYGKAGDLESAYNTLELMKKSGLEPTADTYSALLCAYALNAKNPDSVKKIPQLIEETQRNEISLTDSDYLQVIKILALVDSNSPLIDELIQNVPKTVSYNQECLKTVCSLCHSKQFDVAFKLYDTMTPPHMQIQNRSVGNIFIRQLIRANASPEAVINLCEKLKDKGLNDNAINKATEFAVSYADTETARIYLKKYATEAPLRIHFFWPLLVRCKTEDQVFDILSQDMSVLSNSDFGVIHDTFSDYVWSKPISDVHLFMDKCKAIGFSYVITYNALLDNLIKNHKYNEATNLINDRNYYPTKLQIRYLMQSLVDSYIEKPDAENIFTCLHALTKYSERFSEFSDNQKTDVFGRFILNVINYKQNEFESYIVPILELMNSKNATMLTTSADAIRDRIKLTEANEKLLKSVSADQSGDSQYIDTDDLAKSRRDMSIQELEQLLIEFTSKGLNVIGVLRNLLIAYCKRTKSDDFSIESNKQIQSRVSDIIDQLRNNGVEFNNALNAAIFEFFVSTSNFEKAEEIFNSIPQDFLINPYKIFNFALLYVKNGDLNKAKDLLIAESEKRKRLVTNNEEEPNRRALTQFSDYSLSSLLLKVAEVTKDPKVVKEMFNLGHEVSGMNVTTNMARNLINVHLLNEDYSGALAEYVECYNSYRVIPMKNELMRIFLEKADSSSLQTVIDLSNSAHGEMNTLVDLASSCIDVGKLKQAKKLMETPGLRVRQPKLDSTCERYINHNKVDQLEAFVQITKNLFDIDRDQLYCNLIKAYIKSNSVDKALNVWTSMQEENIQPSNNTLRLLSEFLEQNNVKVPFETPPPSSSPDKETKSKTPEKSSFGNEKISLNQLNNAIRRGSVDEAVEIKKAIEARGESVLLTQNCAIIDSLLESDRVKEACDIAHSLLKKKIYPSPRVLRFLLSKLASKGDIKMIETLKSLLPSSIVQTALYTSILATAYTNAGKPEQFINEVLPDLTPFPLGGLLTILKARPDLEDRILKITNQINDEQDSHLPLNMVWLYYMQTERYDDAQQIFNSSPKFKEFLLFTALLDKIKESKNITMGRKLVDIVLSSNLTPKSVGVAYSALIEAHVELNQVERAEDIITNEILPNNEMRVDSRTGNQVKFVDMRNLSRSSLIKLSNAIRNEKKREPKFEIPKKVFNNASKEEENGHISEEEAVGVKQK